LRFSSHSQAEGDSVRRQTANPEEWCRRNGVKLDTSLVFQDRARSAFKRHHRHREALTEFRRFVAEGRIPPGSYLIIENLDRLSREQERIAVELLLSIVNAGITVVQLMPEEQVFSPANLDMLGLMRAVIQMAQAHQESAKKAKRLGEVWGEKRKAAASGKAKLTSRVPGWVQHVGDKMRLHPERAAIVRRIYKLCIAGYGGQATAALLNKEKVPTLTGRGKWYQGHVAHILRTRAVLGEHQPYTEHGQEKRTPVGDPIPNYYPAVVTEDVYNAAQGAMAGRTHLAGRNPKKNTSLFRGILRDARRGGTIGLSSGGKKGEPRHHFYANSDRIAGEQQKNFPAESFEAAILTKLREIDPREVVGESAAADRVLSLTGERAELVAKINRAVDALGDGDSPAIAAKVMKWEADLRALDDQLVLARQEAADPLANAWGEVPGLVALAGTEDGRVRLAGVLRRVIEATWCLFTRCGETSLAAVQIRFAGGGRREYLIRHTPARYLGKGKAERRPPRWSAVSFFADGAGVGEIDLRKPEHVAAVESLLKNKEAVAELFAGEAKG